jgi:HD superfamily phosphohydrolase
MGESGRPQVLAKLAEVTAKLRHAGVLHAVDAAIRDLLPGGEQAPRAGKIVKDAAWGVVTIPGYLWPFVDSKLLQRQRRTRQLGLSHLVYPAAGHSRFEHALGCCHVMSLILRSVKERDESRRFDDDDERLLLLGALLHDVGHMPFSHVSERVLEQWGSRLLIGRLPSDHVLALVRDALGKQRLHLAELLSILVLLAPSFQKIVAKHLGLRGRLADEACMEVAAYVGGGSVSNERVAHTQVVSGQFDADRLDWTVRDSLACGVPVSVDVPRLLSRCQFADVEWKSLPESMRAPGLDAGKPVTVFATDLTGANALEEMAVSRFLLYDRVYNHHKTRAAEGITWELVERTIALKPFKWDLLQFWRHSDESLLHFASTSRQARIRELAERLLFRDLPKRAATFGYRYIRRPVAPVPILLRNGDATDSETQVDTLIGVMLDDVDKSLRPADERAALGAAVKAEATGLASKLTAEDRPKRPLRHVVIAARAETPFEGMDGAIVIDRDGRATLFREYMPLKEWSQAFSNNKSNGFVYCDPGWENLVLIASEIVFSKQFRRGTCVDETDSTEQNFETPLSPRFTLDDKALVAAKRSPGEIRDLKVKLDRTGAFKGARHLRPLAREAEDKLDGISERLRSFEGPRSWRVTADTVARFVRQFPVRLQPDLVRTLLMFDLLDRAHVCALIAPKLDAICKSVSAGVRVTALSPNSGTLWRQLLEAELKGRFEGRITFDHESLEHLPDDGSAVVFVDDVSASGSQACTQLQAWLGVPRELWADPAERNIWPEPLPDNVVHSLKKRPVRIIVAEAFDDAKLRLTKTATDLALQDFGVDSGKSIGATSSAPISTNLSKYLAHVGRGVLLSARAKLHAGSRPNSRKAAADALGYGGRTLCACGLFNVPTCCPPAFWCPGEVDGTPWMPLLVRRGYESLLVVT